MPSRLKTAYNLSAIDLQYPSRGTKSLRMPHTASLVGNPRQNKLLPALQWQQLYRALRPIFMPLGHVVYEPNAQREHVYFPTT